MMLMIRLARRGKKNKSFYRIIVTEKARDNFGLATEIVGHYNPVSKTKDLQLKNDRIAYWLSKGAQPTETVRNLLIDQKLIAGEKKKAPKRAPKKEKK
ncbi:30S ribosomal protein S16 [Candidatus Uhrbacteria bacterium]|nr:30S ribosomal protein S16 [Candidatus Uhrbacteria bacterium]